MAKSVLAIETPSSCQECRLLDDDNWYCMGYHEACDLKGISNIPSWCPLKPLPEKEEIKSGHMYSGLISLGWNACIDELEGEE